MLFALYGLIYMGIYAWMIFITVDLIEVVIWKDSLLSFSISSLSTRKDRYLYSSSSFLLIKVISESLDNETFWLTHSLCLLFQFCVSRRVDYNGGGRDGGTNRLEVQQQQEEPDTTSFTDYPTFIGGNFNSSQFLRELGRPDSHLATVFQQWMYSRSSGDHNNNTAVTTASDSDS